MKHWPSESFNGVFLHVSLILLFCKKMLLAWTEHSDTKCWLAKYVCFMVWINRNRPAPILLILQLEKLSLFLNNWKKVHEKPKASCSSVLSGRWDERQNSPLIHHLSNHLLNQAHAGHRSAHAWFLKIISVWLSLCLCVCVSVCFHPKTINNYWRDVWYGPHMIG